MTISAGINLPRTTATEKVLLDLRMAMYQYHYKELAKLVNCSPGTIMAIRSGRTKWPRDTTLFKLCDALGFRVTIERLQSDEG